MLIERLLYHIGLFKGGSMSFSILPNRAVLMGFAAVLGISSPALAVTVTGSFTVKININAECRVVSSEEHNFEGRGIIDQNIDTQSAIKVQCTSGTPYSVGLGLGIGAGATLAARKMTGPGNATINYNLYRDAAFTEVWGTTAATDTLSGTGNGVEQSIPVYGRVPAQSTSATGAYSDTVAVAVTY